MNNGQKNIAIVGAGTCGLFLAKKLTEKGHKITVFEQKEKVGGKVCSALISERIRNFVEIPESLIENRIKFCHIHFPKKNIVLEMNPVHLALDRDKLAEQMKNEAEKAGVLIKFSQPFQKMPFGFDTAIGCDGALSSVRKMTKAKSPKFFGGIQTNVWQENKSDFVDVWPMKAGFFWKIPKGVYTEFGFMGNLASYSVDFEGGMFEYSGLKNEEVAIALKSKKSALIPQGLALAKKQNIALCGDAAGLTKPWSGGGVVWGLTAAEILADSFPDLREYERKLRKKFGFLIRKGRLADWGARFAGFNLPFLLPSKYSRDNDFPRF